MYELPKKIIIRNKLEFNKVYRDGYSYVNHSLIIHVVKSDGIKGKIGFAVGKKIGNAVMRNKLRRRLREIIRELKLLFKNNRNYIIIMKKKCLEVDYQELKKSLQTLTGEIK